MLPDILERFPGRSVLVVGDVMLDEYAWGDVRRISPEAPVPVVEVTRRNYAPGGAANVAVNIAALGGRPVLLGVLGNDSAAEQLCRALNNRGVDTSTLCIDADRPTTTKLRIVAHSQQIVRVDSERRGRFSESIENSLIDTIKQVLAGVEVCVISDYGKGLVSERIAQHLVSVCTRAGKPVIVDPKGVDYAKYRGASMVTPNLREAEQASGVPVESDADLVRAGQRLLEVLQSNALLVTRGAEGMSLFTGRDVVHVPSLARSVFDVTGAGDTVVGTLALALACKAPLEEAVRLANLAAGIVVSKVGAASVELNELIGLIMESYIDQRMA